MSKLVFLNPCPFCGHKIEVTKVYKGLRLFKCEGCGAVVSFDNDYCNNNPDSTYQFWNRRVKDGEKCW